jgi:thiol-disulfide isomerase/thioredoxin
MIASLSPVTAGGMGKATRVVPILASLVAALLLLCFGCGDPGDPGDPEDSPTPVPSYSLGVGLDGYPVSTDQFRGKALVVTFWATWCYPCRNQLPELDSLLVAYPSSIRVIGVSNDTETRLVRHFLDHNPLGFPVSLDSLGTAFVAITNSGVIPTTIFLDSQGRLRSEVVGHQSLRQLRDQLTPLVGSP